MLSVSLAVFLSDPQQPVSINSLPPISVTRDWMDWAALVFSAVLVAVGIWGVRAALKTLKAVERQAEEMWKQALQMKEQTEIASKAADAALMNAKALIVSERPWLVVSIRREDPDHPDLWTVRATNKGNTPALLHEGHCAVEVQPLESNFKAPDRLFDPFFAPFDNLTLPGEVFEIRKVAPDTMPMKPNPEITDVGILYVYGRLEYWDTFADRTAPNAKPYVTQWCFAYASAGSKFQRVATEFTANT